MADTVPPAQEASSPKKRGPSGSIGDKKNRKSQFKSPNSSPRGSPRAKSPFVINKVPNEANMEDVIDKLGNILAKALSHNISCPTLVSLGFSDISHFLKDYTRYHQEGGSKSLKECVDKAHLKVLCYSNGKEDSKVTDDEVINLLKSFHSKNKKDLFDNLVGSIRMDIHASTAEEKVSSVFVALEQALESCEILELNEEKQIELVLKSLPPVFRQDVDAALFFEEDVKTKGKLFDIVLRQAKQFSWVTTEKKACGMDKISAAKKQYATEIDDRVTKRSQEILKRM